MESELTTVGNYSFNSKYCLGEGSFGRVYRATHTPSGRTVALKELDALLSPDLQQEIAILKTLQHPNIVRYEDAFQHHTSFYIVTEFCGGGDLRSFQESDEEEGDEQERQRAILAMFWQVCEGFRYLQGKGIIHRDLKPSNVLRQKEVFKIADFGLARQEAVHRSVAGQELLGVPVYMSPQILSKNYYSCKCDVWSLGVLTYELLYQQLPWKSQDVDSLFFHIMTHPRPHTAQKLQVLPQFLSIFEGTLAYLEKQRATWDQLLALKYAPPPALKKKSSLTQSLPKKYSKSVTKEEAEILKHIYSQGQSLQGELTCLTSDQFLGGLFQSIREYLSQGTEWKSKLRDCCFMFLRLLGDKLHIQLMEYEKLEQSRPLLVFIELIHDYLISESIDRTAFQNSIRSRPINEYAASVISKINTFLLDPT